MNEELPICRACLQASMEYVDLETPFDIGQNELVSCAESIVDEEYGTKLTYLDCFRECTGLNVDIEENRPDSLCKSCALELRIAYEFITKAEKAERILELRNEINVGDLRESVGHQVFIEETDFMKLCEYEETLEQVEPVLGDKGSNGSDDTTCSTIKESREHCDHTYNNIDCTSEELEENYEFGNNENIENLFLRKNTEQAIESDLKQHFENSSEPSQHNYCDNKYSRHIHCRSNYQQNAKTKGKNNSRNSSQNNKRKVYENDEAKHNFLCNVCSKTFATLSILKAHLKYHERKQINTKSDACSICGKQFSTNHYLTRHMDVHKNDRNLYECTQCDKLYLTKTALKNHKKLHMGETIKCVSCDKEFSRQYELNVHMRFHTRNFPFECEICGKKFAIKGHLRTHMWRHQGLKLQCEVCGKLFISSKALNEHSFMHSEMPFPCIHCSKSYPSKQKYKVHLKTAHSIELNKNDLLKITKSGPRRPIQRKKLTLVQADTVIDVEMKTKN